MFLCFEYWLKQKLLFVIVAPLILFDLCYTWVPQKALFGRYRKQIKDVFLCRWDLDKHCIEERHSLLPEEAAALRPLCEKYSIDFSDKDVEFSGIGFRFPLDQFCWCLFQAKGLPDHYFVQWEHNDWPPSDAIVLNEEERLQIDEIIGKYIR